MRSSETWQQGHGHDSHAELLNDEAQAPCRKPPRKRGHWLDWLLGTRQGQWVTLIVIGLGLISCCTVTWQLIGGNEDYDTSFKHSLWISWGLFFDPGTQTGISPDNDTPVMVTALVFSVLGFIYNLSVLGILVETVRELLQRLQDTRFKIIKAGHVLLLGWTDKTLFLLKEILEDAEQRGLGKQTVVILADIDATDMQDFVHEHLGAIGHKHCVRCHRGCAYNPDDLLRVSITAARDVIVLGQRSTSHASDLEVVRVMVALAGLQDLGGRIFAEVQRAETAPVVRMVLPDRADALHMRSSVMRMLCLMATCPPVGDCLAVLSSFTTGGEEVYLVSRPELTNDTFHHACRCFPRAICIGIKPADGKVVLAPPDERVLAAGDRLLYIAEDLAATETTKTPATLAHSRSRRSIKVVDEMMHKVKLDSKTSASNQISAFLTGQAWDADQPHLQTDFVGDPCTQWDDNHPSVFIIVGWADGLSEFLSMLDGLVVADSVVHILSEWPLEHRILTFLEPGAELQNIRLEHHRGRRTSVDALAVLPLADARAILVLAEGPWDTGEMEGTGDSSRAGQDDVMGAAAEDSAGCLACAVTICGVCEGRYGRALQRKLQGRLICEVLATRTDRMLRRNRELLKRCAFFRSHALEMGLFGIALSEPTVFNTLVQLLAASGHGARLLAKPLAEFLSAAECMDMGGLSDSSIPLPFWDLHQRVRRHGGDLLIGWTSARTGQWSLSSAVDREQAFEWGIDDRLLALTFQEQNFGEASQTLNLALSGTGLDTMGHASSSGSKHAKVQRLSKTLEEEPLNKGQFAVADSGDTGAGPGLGQAACSVKGNGDDHDHRPASSVPYASEPSEAFTEAASDAATETPQFLTQSGNSEHTLHTAARNAPTLTWDSHPCQGWAPPPAADPPATEAAFVGGLERPVPGLCAQDVLEASTAAVADLEAGGHGPARGEPEARSAGDGHPDAPDAAAGRARGPEAAVPTSPEPGWSQGGAGPLVAPPGEGDAEAEAEAASDEATLMGVRLPPASSQRSLLGDALAAHPLPAAGLRRTLPG